MKSCVLYSPAISSDNIGDTIIAESAKKQIESIIEPMFVAEIATHLPTSWYFMRIHKKAEYKFVLGSNLLKSTFLGLKRQWDVTLRSASYYGPCILIGAGWWQYNNEPNLYTKILYKKILSKNNIHSVRDHYTEKILNDMGIKNVINTGCPTLWDLTSEFCSQIPKTKAKNVVFTLTDYNRDRELDIKLISVLLSCYEKVYFWPQGSKDFDYFLDLGQSEDIQIIPPNLEKLDQLLNDPSGIDYVGTRLHGGIRALQHKRRTIILKIDNRAAEMNKSYNLPVVERGDFAELRHMIEGSFETMISLPTQNIEIWKAQFSRGRS